MAFQILPTPMKRRHFFTTSLAATALPLLAKDEPKTAAPAPAAPVAAPTTDATKLDPNMAAQKAAGKNISWHNPEQWGAEGRCWPDLPRNRYYDRLPASAEGKVPAPVWGLSHHSAGMVVRFKSNAADIHVRYKLLTPNLALPHMPATGASGVDLYARDEKGKWRWVNGSRPTAQDVTAALSEKMTAVERDWMLYLPLYNGVETLEIGVNEGATFAGTAPKLKGMIAFYGTSITHGASASRPGMCHPAILGRRFDMPIVNLGFSGNGRMEASVGEFLAQLEPAVFVIDCLPNMNPQQVTERCVPLVKQLRAARPTMPIVLVEDRRNTSSWIHPDRAAFHTANHAALKGAFAKLQDEGVKNIFYIEGDHLMGEDGDGAADGSHPNDLGFSRHADIFEPVIREALKASS